MTVGQNMWFDNLFLGWGLSDFAIVPRRFYQKNARRRLAAWRRRNETNARTAYPSANPTDRPTANVISTEGVIAP
jgi:hypothetical protein